MSSVKQESMNELESMASLRQSVRNRIGMEGELESDELLRHVKLASNDIKDLFASSFGPRGLNKIIISPTNDIYMTSDGKTIIEQIDVLHPVVSILKELARSMDKACGDGTKTAVIFAASLVDNAVKLIDYGVHPTTIIKGYQLALNKAYEILEYESIEADSEEDLHSVIENASMSKGLEYSQAKMIASVVLKTLSEIKHMDTDTHIDLNDYVKVIKKVGGPGMEWVHGVVLDERPARDDMQSHFKDAKVLLLNYNVKFESKIINSQRNLRVEGVENSLLLLHEQMRLVKLFSEKIIASKADLVLCEGDVDESIEEILAKHGILLFKKLKMKDIEKVAQATNANIISIKDEIGQDDLGFAHEVNVEKRSNEYFLSIIVQEQPISTIIIWEPFKYALEKVEEAVNDALNSAIFHQKQNQVVNGGGGIEFVVSQMLRGYASTFEGKEQLAVIEYANALEEIPRTLARNAGLNELDAMAEMLSNYSKAIDCRIDYNSKVTENYPPVYDSASIKKLCIIAATEATNNILRIDKIILKR